MILHEEKLTVYTGTYDCQNNEIQGLGLRMGLDQGGPGIQTDFWWGILLEEEGDGRLH